jgi:hypothetical protein
MIFNESILLYLIILCQIILIARQMYLLGEFKKNVRRPLMFRSKYLFSKRVKGEDMALVYSLSCEAPVDGDVVERRLTVAVNGETVSTDPYAPDTVDFGEFTFAQDDNVVVSLVDVDDVGNVSDPAVLEFVATDTLPPVVPGGFSVALVREVPDEVDPKPEPEPPPPPADETV